MTRFPILRAFKMALIGTTALALISCAARQEANRNIETQKAIASSAYDVQKNVKAIPGPSNVRVSNDIWLGDRGVKFSNGQPLPVKFEQKNGITLNTGPKTLVQLASLIEQASGVPVRNAETVMMWNYDVADAGNSGSQGGNTNGSVMPAAPQQAGPLGDAFGTGGGNSNGSEMVANSPLLQGTPEFPPMSVHYSGSLSGLLNQVTNHFGISWKYQDGAVKFIGLETQTYTLWALNVIQSTTSSIEGQVVGDAGSSGAAGSSGGTSTNVTNGTQATIASNYWENVLTTIRGILPAGSQFITTNASSGTITVTAKPAIQERIAEYIRNENERLARQVAITVQVYSFEDSHSDNYNLDLSAVFTGLKNVSLGLATNAATGGTASTLASSQFQVGVLNGALAGSNAFINALSEKGKVSLVTSASVTTLNNQTAPISILNQKGYLARVSVTTDGTSGTTTASLEPGVVNSGFTLNVTPRIMSNNEMILNYATTLSDLINMTEFSSNGSSIQIPDVNRRALMQSIRIRSGSTLVLAGFQQMNDNSTDTGVGSPELPIFGGGVSASHGSKLLVIMMTPTVLEDGNQAEAPAQ